MYIFTFTIIEMKLLKFYKAVCITIMYQDAVLEGDLVLPLYVSITCIRKDGKEYLNLPTSAFMSDDHMFG